MNADQPKRTGSGLEETLSVLRRRRAIAIQTFILVLAVGVLVTMLSRRSYRAWARLQVTSSNRSVNLVETSNPFAAMLASAAPESLATQLQVMQSGPFTREARERAKVVARPGVEPANIRIEAVEDASVIQVVVEGGDPEEITRLANAAVDLHLERTDLMASTGLRETLQFVIAEQGRAAVALAAADNALLKFRRQNRVVQLTAEQQAHTREFVDLQARIQEQESNLQSLNAQIRELRRQLDALPEHTVQESVRENPRLGRLREKVDELRFKRIELLPDFRPTSQTIRALDSQIESLEKELSAEPAELRTRLRVPNPDRNPLRTDLARLEGTRQGTVTALSAARSRLGARSVILDNLAPWEVELSRLTRARDAAQAAHASLTDQVRDLQIRNNARVPTARAIERAQVPNSPFKPRRSVNLAITLVVGLCAAIGMAFLQEYLDDRLNTPEDLERISSLPLLATVPHLETSSGRVLNRLPAHSHAAECYRSLRASIQFAGFDAPIRRLLVSSASKGEGKTITSANLAISIAMDGRRVILVDADLRRPGLHGLLEIPSAPGLTELLVGLQPIEAVLRPTSVPGLRVICAGAIPPNPAELLGSAVFERLLQSLQEQCDVLILDSPPCLPVSDPLVLAARADAVVLVVQVGQTRKADLARTEELLLRARARVVGTVYNRMPSRHRGDSSHYHYYYQAGSGDALPLESANGHRPETVGEAESARATRDGDGRT